MAPAEVLLSPGGGLDHRLPGEPRNCAAHSINVWCPLPQAHAVELLLREYPSTQLVVDHLGLFRQPPTGGLLGDVAENDEKAWKALLALARCACLLTLGPHLSIRIYLVCQFACFHCVFAWNFFMEFFSVFFSVSPKSDVFEYQHQQMGKNTIMMQLIFWWCEYIFVCFPVCSFKEKRPNSPFPKNLCLAAPT